MSETLKFEMDRRSRSDREKDLRRQEWIFSSNKIDSRGKWHLFQALFRCRVSYAINLITLLDEKTTNWLRIYWYRALKALLGIR